MLGVRFPHSQEFEDDAELQIPEGRIDIVFAEAKTRHIPDLNGPWGSREKGALEYVLLRIGVVPPDQIAKIAEEVYAKRTVDFDRYRIRIVCLAESISEELLSQGVTFISWTQALGFIRRRFNGNARLKAEHEAWDDFGKFLWSKLDACTPTVDEFFVAWDRRSRG